MAILVLNVLLYIVEAKKRYKKKRLNRLTLARTPLTHISLASFLWDIGKYNSPRCDTAKRGVPSGAILFAYVIFIEK